MTDAGRSDTGHGRDETEFRARAESFRQGAGDYERLRPAYPADVLDHVARTATGAGRVLEVGAGTGRATLALAARGLRILATEPAPAMAEVLAARVRESGLEDRIEVAVAAFEDLDPAHGRYGKIVAAQSFHWADPQTRWGRLADLLLPDGRAVMFWNGWILDPEVHDHGPIAELYAARAPALVPDLPQDGGGDWITGADWVTREVTFSGRLRIAEDRLVSWPWRLAVEDYLGLLATTSQYAVLPEEERAGLLGALRELLGEEVVLDGRTRLVVLAVAAGLGSVPGLR